jgi:hypothetical protein
MNYRISRTALTLVVLLVLVVAALFVYTLISAPTEEPVFVEQEPVATQEERLITAKHQYKDGVHTIAGTAEVPTPCHRLILEPFFVGENEVEVRFSTFLEGEECPGEPFQAPFQVSFEAPEDVTISATWDGAPVRFNLVPVAEGESLDDELYIKG